MKEDFIAFVWKFQHFKKNNLTTTQGEGLQIISHGQLNQNEGPDFFNAQLIIDNQKWAGNVELHVKSSDWYVHGHEKDTNYDNVILHVVWEDDAPVFMKNNAPIPTLEFKNLVDSSLLNSYHDLISTSNKWINCEHKIHSVNDFTLKNWLERLYFERLERKSELIFSLLQESNHDWEAVLFKLLTKNFGLKVNGDAFFEMASNLKFSIIRKEWHKLTSLEALFFGQAGLLNTEIENPYFNELKQEHEYLQKKYNLGTIWVPKPQFFRLRPNNFPTIRLAQLASLYHNHQNVFAKIIESKSIDDFYELFNISASSFWDHHYTFETSSKKYRKKLSKPFIDLLLINTVIPLKFIYQKHLGKPNESAILDLITSIKAEKNSIITKFSNLGIAADSAFETQALIQLKNEYCNRQKCLQCSVGNRLLVS